MGEDDRRSSFEKRMGSDRRRGVDMRSQEEKPLKGERRVGSDRRSGLDRRLNPAAKTPTTINHTQKS